ncbi:hypothetical protein V7654_02625 [Bacillus sp. JJ1609]|uniref:hypothetical protein n=1 Tax=Bacillus sp. JJ1609 TaxID=3122977 RepID=UPI003000616E
MFIKESLSVYNRNLLKIMLISLVLLLPAQFIVYGWMLYLEEIEAMKYLNIISLFLYILLFTVVAPPYIKVALSDFNDEEIDLKENALLFVKNFGVLFIMAPVLFLIGLFGSFLLLIPTILSLGVLFLIPLFLESEESLGQIIRKTMMVLREKYLEMTAYLLFTLSVNILFWYLFTNIVSYFESNILTYIIIRILINLIIFPLFYIVLVRMFHPGLQADREGYL